MAGSPQAQLEELLDECVDSLLAGKDWHECVPADHPEREELIGLMEVAEELMDSMRSAPRERSQERQRRARVLGWLRRAPSDPSGWALAVRVSPACSRALAIVWPRRGRAPADSWPTCGSAPAGA